MSRFGTLRQLAGAVVFSALATVSYGQPVQPFVPTTSTQPLSTNTSPTGLTTLPGTLGGINRPPIGPALPAPAYPGFLHPQELTAPYGLQIISQNILINTSTTPSNGVFNVQNPAIIFNVPILPDVAAYVTGGLHYAYKSVGWKGRISLEMCLTAQEAPSWPGAVQMVSDPATCPQEDYLPTEEIRNRAWYKVASVAVDTYVVQTQGLVDIPARLSANLQQVTAPARLHFEGVTYYYTDVHTGPNDAAVACPLNVCLDYLTNLYTRPFKLVVLPAALIQLKVLPQTIVYLPPGNSSSANYKITATYSTTLAAGSNTDIDNTNANDNWTEFTNNAGVSEDAVKVYDFGYSSSSDTKWDTKTTLGTGQAREHDIQGLNQQQIIVTRSIKAGPLNVPGPAGEFANEPFHNDLIVVLVHPQLAVWDFYGKGIVQLMAANGGPYNSAFSISDLEACSKGSTPLSFKTATNDTETLTPDECLNLARLDPFFGFGQSASLIKRGLLILGSSNYGTDPTAPTGTTFPLDIQTIASTQQTTTDQSTDTYTSTVEDIVATTESTGLTWGVSTGPIITYLTFGFTDTITLKKGSSIDTTKKMVLTYRNSTVTTQREDIGFEGSINDTVNRGYEPSVEVYRDKIFGGLMFRDPTARCEPQPQCRLIVVTGGATTTH
jgi:hypothetical protein